MSNANAPLPVAQLRLNVPITSPQAWTILVGNTSIPAIGANQNRRGIIFANPGSVNIYVVPSNLAAVIGQGILVLPGAQVELLGNPSRNINYNCAWNAIAATGSNNPLTIMDLL